MEYLVTMTTHVPDGTPAEAVDGARAREAARSRERAVQGHLLRLWRGSRISGCRERRSRPIASAALGTFRRPERATGTIEPERRLACWCAPTSGRSVETIRC
jgi:sarcosine oxidase gamma subunit